MELSGEKAIADFGGVRREINVKLLDRVNIGDYVLVHTGFAIEILDRAEALETLQTWKEILQYTDKSSSSVDL
jgi:hydrogenase expression/formation protein HypC